MTDILGHNRARLVGPALQVPWAREHLIDGQLATPALPDVLDAAVAALVAEAQVPA